MALTADLALEALRALALDYRPDLRQHAGTWVGQCPVCGEPRLRIVEHRRGAAVRLDCAVCRDPDAIRRALQEALWPNDRDTALLIGEESVLIAGWALRQLQHSRKEVESLRRENEWLRAASTEKAAA